MKKKNAKKKKTTVAVSGGFDPIHIGHVRMMREARKLGDRLVVILNNDNWLNHKKGYVFMPEHERVEMIKSFPFVDDVVVTDHIEHDPDRGVTKTLRKVRPDIFANGGDRFADNIPEAILCKEFGIKTLFNVGRGGKVQSSSWMIGSASRGVRRNIRPWGEFYNWDEGKGWALKTIYMGKGQKLMLQYHKLRTEFWMLVEGEAIATIADKKGKLVRTNMKKAELLRVDTKAAHRLESKKGGIVMELSIGKIDEKDIYHIEG